ncbi:MAG: response regulator [Kiritimatiellia bacterium]|jgi:PAS domain S-box-containing protein|nr:response regulator [Kiritimatiellia bacterium]MDP6847927.1 response regulator [Kiritimatiellia bacterium]
MSDTADEKEQSKRTVVVVNDESAQVELLKRLLDSNGKHVVTCLSVEEAIQKMDGLAQPPDLIVTDLYMPGIDGWRFCRLLRSLDFPQYNETPILIVSATFAGNTAKRITIELGASMFLPVPFDNDEFLSAVNNLLDGNSCAVKPSVLLVEDDDDLARLMERTLVAHGYSVRIASNGAEGRELLLSTRPNVMILDYHLPDVYGDSLLDDAREYIPEAVPIMITGDTDPGLALSWLGKGACAYIRKPMDPKYLVAVCEKAQRERALLRVETTLEERTKELRDSELRYRVLFQKIPDGILVSNKEGSILDCNDVVADWAGLRREELPGMNINRFLSPLEEGPSIERMQKVFLSGRETFEATIRNPDEAELPVEVCEQMISWHGEEAVLSISRDITERKRIEKSRQLMAERLKQQQKLEAIGMLAGGVAHEINNPINGIMNYAQLILDKLPENIGARRYADEIIYETNRVATIVRNLLSFARQGSRTFRPTKFSDITKAALGLIRTIVKHDQISLNVDLDENLPLVNCDGQRIQQVLLNLLTNARDALNERYPEFDDDKMINITAHVLEEDAVQWLRIVVEDHGVGIPEGINDRIFDPFFTTKPNDVGTGLGLSITHGIVEEHGGRISVESSLGHWTRFRVDLPIESVKPEENIPCLQS